jgi:hypothetical protein
MSFVWFVVKNMNFVVFLSQIERNLADKNKLYSTLEWKFFSYLLLSSNSVFLSAKEIKIIN